MKRVARPSYSIDLVSRVEAIIVIIPFFQCLFWKYHGKSQRNIGGNILMENIYLKAVISNMISTISSHGRWKNNAGIVSNE